MLVLTWHAAIIIIIITIIIIIIIVIIIIIIIIIMISVTIKECIVIGEKAKGNLQPAVSNLKC